MIAPPKGTSSFGDLTVKWSGPETASAVLEASVWHSHKVLEDLEDAPIAMPDVSGLAEWCAEHVEAVTDGEEVVRDPSGIDLDRFLKPTQLIELKEDLVESVALPDDLIERMREYWKMSLGEGCDCPRCKEDDPEKKQEMTQKIKDDPRPICNYLEFDDKIKQIAASMATLTEKNLLDAPFYLYQLNQAFRAGKGEAMEQRRERQEEKRERRKRLKQRGYGFA